MVAFAHAESLQESTDKKDTDVKWLNPATEAKVKYFYSSKIIKVTYFIHFQIYDPIEDVAQKIAFQQR